MSAVNQTENQTLQTTAANNTPEGIYLASPLDQPSKDSTEEDSEKWFPRMKNAWFNYYHTHRNQVICSLIGLLIAVGFLTIGFWPTLLIAVFISIGVFYGRYKDGDRRTRIAIRSLIDRLD